MLPHKRNGQAGMTLTELMMALAVLGVLVGLSAPYLQDTLRNWRITSQTNDLLSDFGAARGQAAGLSVTVTVCASSNGTSCTGSWDQGRLIFTDADADAAIDAGDTIVRKISAINSTTTLAAANLSTAGRVQFRPTGMAAGVTGGGATFKFCDSRTGPHGRTVTLSATGRSSSSTVNCP